METAPRNCRFLSLVVVELVPSKRYLVLWSRPASDSTGAPTGPGKCPNLSDFRELALSAPKSAPRECFLALWGPKGAQRHSSEHFVGTPSS